MENTTTNIKVTYRSGTYITSMVKGRATSCTTDARSAARRMGEKLYGNSLIDVEEVAVVDASRSEWRLLADPIEYAWCWQSGLIEFGPEIPKAGPDGAGAIGIAKGPSRVLRLIVGALAREGWGKSEGKFLVPGVPEAVDGKAQIDALITWHKWCAKGNGLRARHGVRFGRESDGTL